MKQFIYKHRYMAGVAACILLGVITLSFQDTPFVKAILDNQQVEPQDTIKKKKNAMTMKEFNRLSEELEKDVLTELKAIDFAKIEQEIKSSLKEVDVDKVLKEVRESLKEINTEKILMDVRNELKDVKFEKISEETREALKKADKEIEAALAEVKKIDIEELKTELAKARLEVEKTKHEFKKIDMENILKEANDGITKAKSELKLLKQMFNEMEQDGLINLKEGFKIEYRNKDLYINGNRQPERVTDKYKKYFKQEHFEITIEKE